MDVEEQKFMALSGLQMWLEGVLVTVERLTAVRDAEKQEAASVSDDPSQFPRLIRAFNRERHYLLVAANHVLRHIEWAVKLDFLERQLFSEFDAMANTIKHLRDMNEHVVEYFTGGGRRRDLWIHETDASIADASSTVDSRIGGRLDWNELAAAAQRLLHALPPHYRRSRLG